MEGDSKDEDADYVACGYTMLTMMRDFLHRVASWSSGGANGISDALRHGIYRAWLVAFGHELSSRGGN